MLGVNKVFADFELPNLIKNKSVASRDGIISDHAREYSNAVLVIMSSLSTAGGEEFSLNALSSSSSFCFIYYLVKSSYVLSSFTVCIEVKVVHIYFCMVLLPCQ